jgi:hypothetical protein
MTKNVVTIIFLFLIIFVTLMFGQNVEQFDVIDQTDPNGPSNKNNGTYYTKENANGVSVFSAMKDFSTNINRANKTAEPILKECLDDATKSVDQVDQVDQKNACIAIYNAAMKMPVINDVNFWTNANGSYQKLLTAATANPTLKQSPATHATTQANISATNATNKETQQDLDRKMSEMLNDNTGINLESLAKQNSTMYINIAFTVLATTALYYIFVKL